ncbi:MAG TPA: GAF domain-containing protein [Kofleriaceae bacterium]|nr:GAF domain-containing protein [Kofleriaceae bacterium]
MSETIDVATSPPPPPLAQGLLAETEATAEATAETMTATTAAATGEAVAKTEAGAAAEAEAVKDAARHLVHFYEDDESLATSVAGFVGDGLPAGEQVTVIAVGPRHAQVRARLQAAGFDVDGACASGQLTFLDAEQALARILRDGEPDPSLFDVEIGAVLARAGAGGRGRAYGEMVDLLWQRGAHDAALRLEELWNDLQTRQRFTLLCAYPLAGFYREPAALHRVSTRHTHIVGSDGRTGADAVEPAQSAQHAHQLAREIAQREEVEQALRGALRDLRRKEEQLRRNRASATDRAERLLRVAAAIAEAVSKEEVLSAVVDRVAGAVGASSAALWLRDDDGRRARLARAIGYAEPDRFHDLPLDGGEAVIPALDTLRTGEPIWLASKEALLRAYPHLATAVTAGRAYRIACLPIGSHGRTIGSLAMTFDEEREIGDDDRGFLQLVARYAGQALERLRLFDEERRARSDADRAVTRLGVLSRASRTFVEADLELGLRLEEIVRELGLALGGSVGIALVERDGRIHTVAAHHPLPEAEQALRDARLPPVELGEGITGLVVRDGKSILVPTADAAALAGRASPHYQAFLARFPIHAVLCVPLRARGRMIGAVTATRTRPGERYGTDDLELLEELADRAASAIENSRLHREHSEARARAEQLYRFADAAVGAERVEEVFEAALDAIEGALGTRRAAILLYDDHDVMRFRAWRGLSADYRAAVEGHSPWPREVVAPRPVLVPDVQADAGLAPYAPMLRREQIASLAFIPLVSRGRLIGKFMVYHPRAHDYPAGEIDLAGAIANHLASVIARFTAIARLEETIHYNELFAGVLAHDLRNPLGAIMTAAQTLLLRDGDGERNVRPLGRILTSGQRMTRMIDQLLDFTRARVGGGIDIQPRPANLADLCGQAITELEAANPDWRIERGVLGDQDGTWDPDRLLQILSNLIGNAGQHGDVDAGILILLDGRDPAAVTMTVHNRGAIPAALLPSLFDPFRGTRHRRDQSRGLGLGLFIVRELVRAHGGKVQVASTEAKGTTFTIVLPRRAPGAAPGRSADGEP